jgi:hypothetical protein
MNFKLFTVMGISWYLEIMATLLDHQIGLWWTFADIWNLLQGVLIFFIFAFKRSVLNGLMNKFGRQDKLSETKSSNIM